MRALIEEAVRLLERASEAVSETELVSRVLRMAGTGPPPPAFRSLVDEFVRQLAADPRFRREPPDRWRLAVPPGPGIEPGEPSPDTPLEALTFAVVDVETTGCAPPGDRIIEVGGAKVSAGRIVERYQQLVHPGLPIPPFITRLTGIDDTMLEGAPPFAAVADRVRAFVDDCVVVAHNAPFDGRFLDAELTAAAGRGLARPLLCTVRLGRRLLAGMLSRFNLDALAAFYGLAFDGRHRALGDAEVTALVLLRYLEQCAGAGITTWGDLRRLLRGRGPTGETARRGRASDEPGARGRSSP